MLATVCLSESRSPFFTCWLLAWRSSFRNPARRSDDKLRFELRTSRDFGSFRRGRTFIQSEYLLPTYFHHHFERGSMRSQATGMELTSICSLDHSTYLAKSKLLSVYGTFFYGTLRSRLLLRRRIEAIILRFYIFLLSMRREPSEGRLAHF